MNSTTTLNEGMMDDTIGVSPTQGGDYRRKKSELTDRDVMARLSRIEGQIRGIRNMHTEGRICVDVVTQIAAVRAALKKVADVLVASHVEGWIDEMASNPKAIAAQDIQELLKVFTQYYR